MVPDCRAVIASGRSETNCRPAHWPLSTARIPQAGHYRASTRSAGDPRDVEKLADLLVHAKKPAILLGSQVWTTRATDSAIELVRTLNIPAYMNGAGRGSLPRVEDPPRPRSRSAESDPGRMTVSTQPHGGYSTSVEGRQRRSS